MSELLGYDFEQDKPIGFELVDVIEIETHTFEYDGIVSYAVIAIVLENDVLISEPDTDIDEMIATADTLAAKVIIAKSQLN